MFGYKLKKEDYDFYLEVMQEVTNHSEYSKLHNFIQHGDTTVYEHCMEVAYLSYVFAKKLGLKLDYRSLIRGALLHDFFLYDWHTPGEGRKLHGFYHPGIAYRNARKFYDINEREKDIITTHMWPLTLFKLPKYAESIIVTMVDKYQSLKETVGFRYQALKKKFLGYFNRNAAAATQPVKND